MKIDDALWKGLIEDLSDDFLKFFFPDSEEIFDFTRKISFLDKELIGSIGISGVTSAQDGQIAAAGAAKLAEIIASIA